MSPALVLAALAFGGYRIARLVTTDTLFERPRDRLIAARPPGRHKLTALATCPFCVGWWTTGGLLGVAHLVDLARWPLRYDLVLWWAAAGAQATLAALDGWLTA